MLLTKVQDCDNKAGKADACGHDSKYEIFIQDDNEIVCGKCGMVKNGNFAKSSQSHLTSIDAMASDTSCTVSHLSIAKSHISLYLEAEIGGKPDRTMRASRYVRDKNQDLACISNIAQKLNISNVVARSVWRWYLKLRRARGLKLTRAKILVIAFWMVCRCYGHPVNEEKLMEAIRVNLGVKKTYSYLKAIMEASSYMTDDGKEMILKEIGFFDMAPMLCEKTKHVAAKAAAPAAAGATVSGGATTEENNHIKFSLHNEIFPLADDYRADIAGEIATVARSILPVLVLEDDGTKDPGYNPTRAARAAVQMAKHRCGIKKPQSFKK